MTPDPHWTTWVSALLTPTVAIFGGYIALQQWRTARNKLKFDLFDRRMKVYEAVNTLLVLILREGKVTDEVLYTYAARTQQSQWLFGPEIQTYLDKQVWHRALEVRRLTTELDGMPVGDERSAKVKERGEIKKQLLALPKASLIAKFVPYLRLYH